MSNEQKPGDPADRVIDAKADGAFGGAHSHRAGYGGIEFEGQTYTKLEWVERTARIGGTLAAGEGRMLLAENDRLRNELKTQTETVQYLISERTADREHWGAIEDSLNRAERILAALREPSNAVVLAADKKIPILYRLRDTKAGIIAAVAAAEQEVGRE